MILMWLRTFSTIFLRHTSFWETTHHFGVYRRGMITEKWPISMNRVQSCSIAQISFLAWAGCCRETCGASYRWSGQKRRFIESNARGFTFWLTMLGTIYRFWDDWIRHPEQRKGRACIRPEIPRTRTFGKIGVSKWVWLHCWWLENLEILYFEFDLSHFSGLFFEKHLRYIKLSEHFVSFTKMNLTHLLKVWPIQFFPFIECGHR